jgi:TRAP-type uncharacterized transport system substrate-binding protein
VQEETVSKGDFIRNQIDFIAPLYLERIHILFRISPRYKRIFSKNNPPVLTSNSDPRVLSLFANAKISTGPVGSGTRVIASYIMSEINAQIRQSGINENQQVFNLSMAEGLEKISKDYKGDDQIEIFFTMAGAPLKDVKDLLGQEGYTLVSIGPSLVTQINRDYEVNLRMTDFKHSKYGSASGIYYDGSKNVSTLGSYAWLISSKNIPSGDILEVLKIAQDKRNDIAHNLGVENVTNDHSPMAEIKFYDLYKSKFDEKI